MPSDLVGKGRYKVVLGKSFADPKIKKRAPKFYHAMHTKNSDPKLFKKEAMFRKEKGKQLLDMSHGGRVPTTCYDVEMKEAPSLNNCIFIFDEKAMTCTVERQTAYVSMCDRVRPQPKLELPPVSGTASVQNKLHLPPKPSPLRRPSQGPPHQVATPPTVSNTRASPTTINPKAPTKNNSRPSIINNTEIPPTLINNNLPPVKTKTSPSTLSNKNSLTLNNTTAPPIVSNGKENAIDIENDDFDFDISQDMDAILVSDSEDDDKGDSDSGEVFEEIEAVSLQKPTTTVKPTPPTLQAANTNKPISASPLTLPPTPKSNANGINKASISPRIPMVQPPTRTPPTAVTNHNTSELSNNDNTIASLNNGNSNIKSQSPANPRKRKLQMASAPIRHLDSPSSLKTVTPTSTPPIATPPTSSSPVGQEPLSANAQRAPSTLLARSSNPISLKSASTNAPLAPQAMTSNNKLRKLSRNDDVSNGSSSESSSSEESDSGSESGSTETSSSAESGSESGSSSSGSDTDSDDDDDFESLAHDISMSLDPSAPSSPLQPDLGGGSSNTAMPSLSQSASLNTSNTPSSVSSTVAGPSVNNTKKPMSLRALLKDEEESEETSGSDSE